MFTTKKPNLDKGVIIEGIEFGKENLKIGIFVADFKAHIEKKFPEADPELVLNVFRSLFFSEEEKRYGLITPGKKYFLNTESYFKYIDWQELNEARKTSRDARFIAMVSITISIILTVSSILIQLFHSTDIVIDGDQFTSIKSLLENLIKQ